MASLTYGKLDLFTFSHGSNWNKQGGRVTLMWLCCTLKKSSWKRRVVKAHWI